MKAHLLVITGLMAFGTSFAQTEVDLYRYSNTFNEGSARFQSMAGSFGALGADPGSASINPAGFARFSNSQFNIAFSNISISNTADFNSETVKSTDNRFKLASIAAVLTSDVSASTSGWLYQQLGVGYNSVANFTNSISYSGEQYYSLLDGFAAQAAGTHPDDLFTNYPFSSHLAYQTYAIDPDGSEAPSYFPRISGSSNVYHKRTIDTRGGIGEFFFSYSGNYLNKLYLGANVGIQNLKYTENMKHHEDVINPQQSLQGFDYTYNYKTKGNGTNVKIGAIYLPVESVRVGLAYHSPTFFELTDTYDANMTAYHDTMTSTVDPSLVPSGQYKYRLRTPSRMIGSLAYIYEDHGCINVDLEYLNYKWAHFKTTTDEAYPVYDYTVENEAADKRFTSAINLRVGAEVVILQNFFLRGGYAMYQKGDKNLTTFGGKFDTAVSGGIGARINNWTLDLGVRNLKQTGIYSAFPESRTNITTNSMYVVVNAQVKF